MSIDQPPTDLIASLWGQLGTDRGPVERVYMDAESCEWKRRGFASPLRALMVEAAEVSDELRRSLGPTADPSWIPSLHRWSQEHGKHGHRFLAVFGRGGKYSYVIVRAEGQGDPNDVALCLGVLREPEDAEE